MFPREGYFPAKNAELYFREIGQGPPVIILYGGPDFDQSYLLPDLDRLADSFRLIYYAQSGRGKSAGNVQPKDVSIESDKECGHFSYLECPDEVQKEISDFLLAT